MKHLIFQLMKHQSLVFCRDEQKVLVNLCYAFCYFLLRYYENKSFFNIIFIPTIWILLSSLSCIFLLLVPYANMFSQSNVCFLCWSWLLKAILLNFTVNMLCLSLWNLSCSFSIILFFLKILLWLFQRHNGLALKVLFHFKVYFPLKSQRQISDFFDI